MSYPKSFEGFAILDHKTFPETELVTFEPREFIDTDVDIKIECCGVCGSDVHAAKGGWGDMPKPCIVGHEIVGQVIKVGSAVKSVKMGDRVGVGAQVDSCGECDRCKDDNEQYCNQSIWTYTSMYENGYITKGGFSSYIRVRDHYVFKIPEALESKVVAPMFCGGITVFSPLIRNGCGPGKKIGISGIGGIGHMGILFAKALGAEVYAISRSESKKMDSLNLGADYYMASDKDNWNDEFRGKSDLIILCGSSFTGVNLDAYLSLLKVNGTLASISAPTVGEKLSVDTMVLSASSGSITSSRLGSRKEIIQMLDLAAQKNIKPWIENIPISTVGISEALRRADSGDVRYRFVLTDYHKTFDEMN